MKKLAYRNKRYLDWVRTRKCIVTGEQAEVAHHVRDGDNSSGIGLRPSDYRVLPLLSSYHTTGPYAIHSIGAQTFYQRFNVEPQKVIVSLLKKYLADIYGVEVLGEEQNDKDFILSLEMKIESLRDPYEVEDERRQDKHWKGLRKKSRKSSLLNKKKEWAKEMRDLQKTRLKNSKEHQSYLERVKNELSKRRRELYRKIKKQSEKRDNLS